MGLLVSKDAIPSIDQATSNSSLPDISSFLVGTKPRWKVFSKKEVVCYPVQPHKPGSGKCSCGQNRECFQKVTPKGVTMHYPQRKRCNSQQSNKLITWRLENQPDSPFKATETNPFGVSHGLPSCLRPTRKVITPRPYKPLTATF